MRKKNQTSKQVDAPKVRLAVCVHSGSMSPEAFERHLAAPNVRLAVTNAMASAGKENAKHRYPHHLSPKDGGPSLSPALLVSYVFLEPFMRNRANYHYRDWVLDSGAFSAHNSGIKIELDAYIDTCKRLLAEDSKLTEVFALDVIGDWKASLKNCELMWKAGVPAIPCFHVGEPESALLGMARDYPKIALGGAVGYKDKNKWAEQCFARVWPKAIHGFGFGAEKSILMLPWHSVDATNWEIAPCKYGRWHTFGKMSVRGSKQNLRAEIEYYLKLEHRARIKWAKEMALLDRLGGPNVRLACNGQGQGELNGSLGPDLRLTMGSNDVSGSRANKTLSPNVRLAVQCGTEGRYEALEPADKEPSRGRRKKR